MGQTEGSLPHPLPTGYANEYLLDIILSRAILFLDMGKPRKAIADLNQAMRLNTSKPILYCLRGLAYEGAGEQEKADADFLKAEDLGWDKQEQEYTGRHMRAGDYIRIHGRRSIVQGVHRNPS